MRENNDNLKTFLQIVGVGALIIIVLNMIPEQPWSYDKRPLCSEGYTATLAAEGSYLVCTEKGGYYDTYGKN